tara:strand:+ start:47 stop:928 length:882 start_codon:yes stop_codon:yes gene_type:complete
MPHKDWYWDNFKVDVNQNQLDLSDKQTAALAADDVEGRLDYTDAQEAQYETRFIDELYGTDNRAWEGKDAPTLSDVDRAGGELADMGRGTRGRQDHTTWGLDLVRDWTGKEDLKFGTTEHYEHQTRGKIDWSHYYNDNAYRAAFKREREGASGFGDMASHADLESYLTAKEGGGAKSDYVSLENKISFLRSADLQSFTDDKGKEELRETWDNKYIDQFDPDKAKPYEKSYLEVPDLWAPGEPIAEKVEVTAPKQLPSLATLKRIPTVRPDNIPTSWGDIKQPPADRYVPGGPK